MTEQEWLECTDPASMLEFLRGKVSDRKLRLFACACWRSTSNLLTTKKSWKVIEIAERYADGFISKYEFRCWGWLRQTEGGLATLFNGIDAAVASAAATLPYNPNTTINVDQIAQGNMLRDIFGNPFRPVAFDPAWRTPNVTAIAQTIYEERRFADMPILADALEEAGCTSADILDHCRGPAEHVRGCWVVDLVLAKE